MKRRYIFLTLAIILISLFFSFKVKASTISNKFSFGENEVIRSCDLQGCGHFGASRTHGTHKGIDLVRKKYSHVYVPFDCFFERVGKVYSQSHLSHFDLVVLVGEGEYSNYKMKIMYVDAFVSPNISMKKGEYIGSVQDLESTYQGITNHIHVELYIDGVLVDPTLYIFDEIVIPKDFNKPLVFTSEIHSYKNDTFYSAKIPMSQYIEPE